jgi:predicted site-specific integrase-resolvase
MNDGYSTPREAAAHFGVAVCTLRQWEEAGLITGIRTKGGHRRYDINSYKNPDPKSILRDRETRDIQEEIRVQGSRQGTEERDVICYSRVSSRKQNADLTRQVEYLKSLYPSSISVTDIGSGLNFKRVGFLSILERASKGTVREVIVAHKDRLCRFGFELVLWFFSKYGVKLTVLEEDRTSPDEELSKDILAIVHVFSCRANGRRKYKRRNETNIEAKEEAKTGEENGR